MNRFRALTLRDIATQASIPAATTVIGSDTGSVISTERNVNEKPELATTNPHDMQKQTDILDCADSTITFWIRLMRLPLELRENVCAELFANSPSTIVIRYSTERLSRIFPAICYVNKQIFDETIPIFLRGREMHVSNPSAFKLAKFLDRVADDKAYKAITKLCLEDVFTLFPSKFSKLYSPALSRRLRGTHALIHWCSGVTHLDIEFKALSFIDLESMPDAETKPSKAEVLNTFDLTPVFKMPRLRILRVDLKGGTLNARRIGCTRESIFEHLVDWLVEEVKNHYSHIDLSIIYSEYLLHGRDYGTGGDTGVVL